MVKVGLGFTELIPDGTTATRSPYVEKYRMGKMNWAIFHAVSLAAAEMMLAYCSRLRIHQTPEESLVLGNTVTVC